MNIREFINPKLDEQEKQNFKKNMILDNIRRGRILALVSIVFEGIYFIICSVSLFLSADKRFQYYNYLIMYFIMIIISSYFLILIKNYRIKNISEKNIKCWEIHIIIYITMVMTWGSVVSLFDQKLYGQVVVFIINMLICSVVFFLDYKKIFIPFGVSILALATGLPFFQKSGDILVGHYVNLSFFIVVAWIASRILFNSYYKDFKSKTLLEKSIEENKEINTRLSAMNHLLEEMSLIDDLTKIPNRRSFRNYIERELKNITRENVKFSVIIADIDFFKDYNDYYGHLAGDNVLISVAGEFNSSVHSRNEFAARWGGEEFIFASFESDEEYILKVCEEIRGKILKLAIPHALSKASDKLTISIGVCTRDVKERSDISKIIEAADKALYMAKSSGRNCIKICE